VSNIAATGISGQLKVSSKTQLQAILGHPMQLSASGIFGSHADKYKDYCLFCVVKFIYQHFRRTCSLKNNGKHDSTASHPRQKSTSCWVLSLGAPLPYLDGMIFQVLVLQSDVPLHCRQELKSCGYKDVQQMGTVQFLCCAFLYSSLAHSQTNMPSPSRLKQG
jgi:hypothetical protein